MKSLIVRLSVLALSITGFAATTFASHSAAHKDLIKPVVVGGVCTPTCNPWKSTCGLTD